MVMRKRIDTMLYVGFDWLAAVSAWFLFFYYRKLFIEEAFFGNQGMADLDDNLIKGLLLLPLGWIALYALMGTYNDVYRKSRLNELGRTFFATAIGVVILFFVVIIDDTVFTYRNYYQSLSTIFLLHFGFAFLLRLLQLTSISNRFEAGDIRFNTLIIGDNQRAVELLDEVNGRRKPLGNKFLGFVRLKPGNGMHLLRYMPELGSLEQLPALIREHKIEEVIIALEEDEHRKFNLVLNTVKDEGVIIKIIPDMYDIMLGHVKMEEIFGAILIEIYPEMMPAWQKTIKKVLDRGLAILALLLLAPAMLYCAIRVRWSSKGPIIYQQERVGQKGKSFNIYKFRSMYIDAEVGGPALSSDNDPRITRWGAVMRKWRLDELPQFFNVLKGEMSIVGPRPERQYFIDQIMAVAPHYKHLLKVKPGITSWGQVKYGYAENIDQMVERLKFDILYIENMSLLVDFKIMIYTVLTLLEGRGK
jgi:exopolysaccharide biosynthesis polyprenyl glycosylphosphotransferase